MAEIDARTRIREVALDLFGRHGVRDTSTRDILTAAGMKNPSAITYHFGSKAELIEDLVRELYLARTSVLPLQIELAERPGPPDIEAWAAIAANSAADLISTERGRLLARVWWEYDGYVNPNVFEDYLASGHPTSNRWMDAVATMMPDFPRYVALARNITMLRTLEWMIARRAGRLLTGRPVASLQMDDPEAFRQLMFEVSVGILTVPTTLGDDAVKFGADPDAEPDASVGLADGGAE
jgi:TetR/AcrR family transcriptional regulator, regulator of cefoperazone and chloramphenicol sensitivity